MSHSLPYYLGCPVWVCDAWVGSVYAGKSRSRWLGDYTRAFNAVEGNSTFYALPKADTVRRWADEAADGFRFVLKFPKAVTHEKQLLAVERETDEFLKLLAILHEADRLGPAMLQLPPYFAGSQLASLEAFLKRLPREFRFACEVRHADFFAAGPTEQTLDALLANHKINRVLFDSRPLFSAAATDEFEVESQGRKPKLPARFVATSDTPVVRLVGRDNVSLVAPWLEEWAEVVAGWLARGLTPYFFTHAPNNAYAPILAEMFHARLSKLVPKLPPLPTWPGKAVPKQQSLF